MRIFYVFYLFYRRNKEWIVGLSYRVFTVLEFENKRVLFRVSNSYVPNLVISNTMHLLMKDVLLTSLWKEVRDACTHPFSC